jgi:alkylation response protein AidB-like acyl-CoA dehydrogenase
MYDMWIRLYTTITTLQVMPFVHDWDESKKIPAEVFKEFGQLGMVAVGMGPPWNSELFGMEPPCGIKESEWDAFHELVVVDELCRCGSGGVAWGMLGGSCIGVPPIMTFASDDLKRRVVPEVIQGDAVACLAITEPYAGSDVAQIRTSAKKSACGKFYVVNGEKKWITNGMFAKWFTVAVRTGGDGAMGISLLCISREMAGVKTKQMDCSGVWGSGTAYVTFEDVKVPVENLVGKENLGFKYIMYNFNHERWGLALQALRFSRVCLEESIVYANKRKTFGKPLIKNQAIRHKLAEMARQVESSWAWLEHLTFQLTQLDHKTAMLMLGGQMALLKVQSSKVFEFCAREAQQIFGGLGYTRSGPGEKVERLAREVRVYAVAGGSEEILRDLSCKIEEKKSKMIHKALNNRASM